MRIVILLFLNILNCKKDADIQERQRLAPVQNCEVSFRQYNAAYNSTILLDQSTDGRYGRFSLNEYHDWADCFIEFETKCKTVAVQLTSAAVETCSEEACTCDRFWLRNE